jgi:hypothetical protein
MNEKWPVGGHRIAAVANPLNVIRNDIFTESTEVNLKIKTLMNFMKQFIIRMIKCRRML